MGYLSSQSALVRGDARGCSVAPPATRWRLVMLVCEPAQNGPPLMASRCDAAMLLEAIEAFSVYSGGGLRYPHAHPEPLRCVRREAVRSLLAVCTVGGGRGSSCSPLVAMAPVACDGRGLVTVVG